MNPRKRYSNSQQQETISRSQFNDFIAPFGWIVDDIQKDVGEDLLVRIFDNGVSTGLSCFMQIKSVKKITSKKLRSGVISYSFDVDDLKHWYVQIIPVFLCIWDVSQRVGWWMWIQDLVNTINEQNPNWENQQSVNVHFSKNNVFDREGLVRIRSIITDHYFPLIAQGKNFSIEAEFIFPPTESGKEKLEEFKRHLTVGDEVVLEGKYIEKFKLPDWFTRVQGEIDPRSVVLKLGPSKRGSKVSISIDFISLQGEAERLDHVELTYVKGGEEEITFSNEAQGIPFVINLLLRNNKPQQTINIRIRINNADTVSAHQAMKIQSILACGGRLILSTRGNRNRLIIPVEPGSINPPDEDLYKFVQNLRTIQVITDNPIVFPSDGTFRGIDVTRAEHLAQIVSRGKQQISGIPFSLEIKKPAIENLLDALKRGDKLRFRLEGEPNSIQLLGTNIELGPVVQTIEGKWILPVDEVISWLANANVEDELKVELTETTIFTEFVRWKKSEKAMEDHLQYR